MTGKPEREVDARLADWVDGRLSERERERFVAELRVSPQLRKDLEDYEKTVAAVRAALQAPARPVHIADRVMAAIAAGNPRSSVGPRWRNRSFLWSLASAAALLVLALLVNTWSPAPKTDTMASLDAAKTESGRAEADKAETFKAEAEKRALSDDRRKNAHDEPAVREHLEMVAVEEQLKANAAKPAQPAPPTAPAPAAEAPRDTRSADGNESARVGAEIAQAKPAAEPVPKVQPATDPAAAGDAGAKQAVGGGGQADARPQELSLGALRASGTHLPLVVVQGGAITSESRLDRQSGPTGPSTGGPAPAKTPAPEAPAPGTAMRKAAEATELPRQLDAFFKRQMTVAPGVDTFAAGTWGEAWSVGELRFTPLPAAPARSADRKETEAKELGEATKDRSRAGVGGKADAKPVERGWLVEGSQEDLEIMLHQLALFAQSSGMDLTRGETSEATLPPRTAPEGAAEQSRDQEVAGRRALPRLHLVLRFSARPR